MKYIFFFTAFLSVVLSSIAEQPSAGENKLNQIWADYQSKLSEAIQGPKDSYLKSLEQLDREALRNNDPIGAAAIRSERDSSDPGEAPLAIAGKKTTRYLMELRRLRTEFERKREEVIKGLLVSCRAELERAERAFTQNNDPVSAAVIRVEREAVSKPLLRIINASYGTANRVDITLPLRKAVKFNRLEIATGNRLAGDPAPFQIKNTLVTFQVGSGPEKTIRLGELGVIKIP